jgi:polar amino acid transport system ATP-binding protein
MKIVSLHNITKKFGKITALDNISLDISKGEIVTIIGPSGSGKSTLLRCINQLEKIDCGIIEIEGEPTVSIEANGKQKHINKKKALYLNKKLGMVFQHFNLFPHKTVLENIMEAPIVVNKIGRAAAEKDAIRLLEVIGLLDKKNEYPAKISGGQKQRVAIARALSMHPDILLCDEPTSALDPELVGEVLITLKKLAAEKMTMFIVTHEMAFAKEISNRIIFMDEGKIIEEDTPSKFFTNPGHPRVKEFISKFLNKN